MLDPRNMASPQDTYDATMGSGALGLPWWGTCEVSGGVGSSGIVTEDWEVTLGLEAEDTREPGGEIIKTFKHADVIDLARRIVLEAVQPDDVPKQINAGLKLTQECANLIFQPDFADMDAGIADNMLQLIVAGKIIYE